MRVLLSWLRNIGLDGREYRGEAEYLFDRMGDTPVIVVDRFLYGISGLREREL